jgi:molybdopterin-guanine dinucleotide biosynthesis protein A
MGGGFSVTVLPVHGFVLAGGMSSRMGADKALLRFCGRPMVEIAVEKLRGFCAEVGIAGNREDLAEFATVVPETRVGIGPAAGIEAGLGAASQRWVLFMPVDVPLMPVNLLRGWAEAVLAMDEVSASYLYCGRAQPAFCMLRSGCREMFSQVLDDGERRVGVLLERAGGGFLWRYDVEALYGKEGAAAETAQRWFANVNTPEERVEAERWASGEEGGSDLLDSNVTVDADALGKSVHHKKNCEKN